MECGVLYGPETDRTGWLPPESVLIGVYACPGSHLVFVERVLEREPGQVLTVTNAYLVFTEYLRGRGMVPVKRSILGVILFHGVAPFLFDVTTAAGSR
jgi:hypothetical protein